MLRVWFITTCHILVFCFLLTVLVFHYICVEKYAKQFYNCKCLPQCANQHLIYSQIFVFSQKKMCQNNLTYFHSYQIKQSRCDFIESTYVMALAFYTLYVSIYAHKYEFTLYNKTIAGHWTQIRLHELWII